MGAAVVTAAVIGSVVALPLLTASDTATPQAAPSDDAVPVKVAVQLGSHGVSLAMSTSFAQDVTLSRPVLRVGDHRSRASLWPDDGEDHEGQDLDPLDLPKGTPVSLESGLMPPCDGSAADEVVFEVRVRGRSGTEVRRFTSQTAGILAKPTEEWCSFGPQVSLGGGRLSPDGDAKVDMSVINPGPDPIVVEVPAFSQGGATWRAASVTVPASRAVDFVVRGSGVRYDGTQEVPWDDGRLLVDGTSFELPEQADGWLG